MRPFIDKLKKKIKKQNKNIIVADFETIMIDKVHHPYAIGVFDGKKFKSFYDFGKTKVDIIEMFLLYLSKYGKNYVYFHNLSRFDGIFLLKYISDKKILDSYVLIRKNKILTIRIGSITFLDSLNIVNLSLNKASMLLIGDNKIDFDTTSIKNFEDVKKKIKKIEEYLEKDCVLLYKVLDKLQKSFRENFDFEIIGVVTMSSAAFKIFRSNFMESLIYNTNHNEKKEKFIRESYHGGLNNVIKTEMQKGYCYDINSSYPSVMEENLYPIDSGKWMKVKRFEELIGKIGFIKCYIEVSDNVKFPFLSIKNEDKTLIQPIGKFEGVFSITEIAYALENNCCKILKIGAALVFHENEYLFKDYINKMYHMRKKNIDIPEDKLMYKLLMNSLYGRFGMQNISEDTFLIEDKPIYELLFNIKKSDWRGNLLTVDTDDNNLDWILENPNLNLELKNYIQDIFNEKYKVKDLVGNVAISSLITAQARIKLHKAILSIEKRGGTIFYYDTDSIFTDLKLSNSKVSDNLGDWKLEYEIKKGIFLASKCYIIKTENNKIIKKFKGINSKYMLDTDFEEFYKALKKGAKFDSIVVENNFLINKEKLHIYTRKNEYNPTFLSKKYEKIYENDKFVRTRPINLNEEIKDGWYW